MNKPLSIALVITIIVIGGLFFLWRTPESTDQTNQAPSSTVDTPSTSTTDEESLPPPPPPSSGNITVTSPMPNDTIGAQLLVTGDARVFENVVNYRLKDANNVVLAEGTAMANAPDIGQFGPYTFSTSYTSPTASTGTLEVFTTSAKDGSEIDMVSVPVNF